MSVVIPVHNEARYLDACLRALAAQTVCPLEIIMVDNNSTDASAEIAARHRSRVGLSARRVASGPLQYARYVWRSPSTYARHGYRSRWHMGPVVLVALLVYLPGQVLHRAFDPATGTLSWRHLRTVPVRQ